MEPSCRACGVQLSATTARWYLAVPYCAAHYAQRVEEGIRSHTGAGSPSHLPPTLPHLQPPPELAEGTSARTASSPPTACCPRCGSNSVQAVPIPKRSVAAAVLNEWASAPPLG